MRKAPSLLILCKRSSAVFLLQSPANHSLSSRLFCLVTLIPPWEATGLVSGIGGFGGLALGSFMFGGRCGLAPGIGGGGFAKVGRRSSAEGPLFLSSNGGKTKLDLSLGIEGFFKGI